MRIRTVRAVAAATVATLALGSCSSAEGSEAFCQKVRESVGDEDPAAALAALRIAPGPIEDEAEQMIEILEKMAVLEDEGDPAAFALVFQLMSDDDFRRDLERLGAYVEEECGVELPEASFEPPELPELPEPMPAPEIPDIEPPQVSIPAPPEVPEVPPVPAAPAAPQP